MTELNQSKTQGQVVDSKEEFAYISAICTRRLNIYYDYKIIYLDNIFNKVLIDDKPYYTIKDEFKYCTTWYSDKVLRLLYKFNTVGMCFDFRNNSLPVRCDGMYTELVCKLQTYIRQTKCRVSNHKVKLIVKSFVKNISRLKYHSKFALKFTQNNNSWSGRKGYSREYFIALIRMLQESGDVTVFKGFQYQDENIQSMMVVNPEFIQRCNPCYIYSQAMEDCLRPVNNEYAFIQVDKSIVKPKTKEEQEELNVVTNILKIYEDEISKRQVCINGILVPEIFFRRIYSEDLFHGARIYEKGNSLQGVNDKIRSTTTIDGMPTVEKDYKHLHIAMAYEEKGLVLGDKDPYDYPVDINLDQKAIDKWAEEYKLDVDMYDPVRNLKKNVLLTMINASSKKSAIAAISKNIYKDYRREDKSTRMFVGIVNAPVKDLVEATMKHNKDIEDYFLSGAGRRFQKLDSDMIYYCIKKFLDIDDVCFPIHDSLIVKEVYGSLAEKTMEDAYEHVMGSKINCKIK